MNQVQRIQMIYPEIEIAEGRNGLVIFNFDELPFNVAYGMSEEQFIKYVLDKI